MLFFSVEHALLSKLLFACRSCVGIRRVSFATYVGISGKEESEKRGEIETVMLKQCRIPLSRNLLPADGCWLQDNCLLNLEHLGMQPDLGVLRAERNLIDNFYGAERCPKLKEVRTSAPPTAPLCNARTCTVTIANRCIWMAIPSSGKHSSTSWRA